MIKFCLDQWERNKDKLKEQLETRDDLNRCEYIDLVKLVVDYILNDPDNGEQYLMNYGRLQFDSEHITEINDGDYQGTLLYLIPFKTYQPSESEYLMTFVDYGSCSYCDTLQNIQHCYGEKLSESQVDEFMTLCKDLVTSMIKPYNTGWRAQPAFDTVEEPHMSCDTLNKNKIWVTPDVYERIEAYPNSVTVEAQGKPLMVIKVIAKGV